MMALSNIVTNEEQRLRMHPFGEQIMADFTGKVILVTGASGVLGSAVGRAFFERGAMVALVGRSTEKLRRVLEDVPDSLERVMFASADVSLVGQVDALVASVLERFGRIDVLVNTVGGYTAAKIQDMTPETWDGVFDLNLRPAFYLSRAVIPGMLEAHYGRIIHTSARAALAGAARRGAYSAAKSALIRLTESLAAELREDGITANCILPGTIDTPTNRQDMPNADFSRWVPAEALVEVILFLASEAAWAVSGAAIPVYGRSSS